jgi:hypothetical protein
MTYITFIINTTLNTKGWAIQTSQKLGGKLRCPWRDSRSCYTCGNHRVTRCSTFSMFSIKTNNTFVHDTSKNVTWHLIYFILDISLYLVNTTYILS